jgi:AcrR family transcriptional regulator
MGRPARYEPEAFLSAALRLAAEGPASVTVSAIARRVGAPIGSMYHRFPSRGALLAQLWLRAAESFQEGFIDALEEGDALGAALHTPRWVRGHPDEARLLLLHRREDLASGPWPRRIRARAEALRLALDAALRGFAVRRGGRADAATMRRVVFALVDVPYAAVRRHLRAGESPPGLVDALITETCIALLGDE